MADGTYLREEDNTPIGEMLVKKGYISEDEKETLMNASGEIDKPFGELAVERDYCKPSHVLECLCKQFGLESYHPLNEYIDIPDDVDSQTVNQGNIVEFEARNVLPLEDGSVIISDPLDGNVMDFVYNHCDNPEIKLTTSQDLQRVLGVIRENWGVEEEEDDIGFDEQELDEFTKEKVDSILHEAVRKGYSDIHFIPARQHIEIKARREGNLVTVESIKTSKAKYVISYLKTLCDLKTDISDVPQDGRYEFMDNSGTNVSMRLNFMPVRTSGRDMQACTVRVLSSNEDIPATDELGYSESEHDKLMRLIRSPHGIILIGSGVNEGKTTTIFSCLNQIMSWSRGRKSIVTVEDPVEYTLPLAKQSQINEEKDYGFAEATRAALRQDYDIMLVGEIRDEETAQNAIKGALAGKLLFATIHANDAFASFHRMMEFDVSRQALSEVMRSFICQRLLRTVCSSCSETVEASLDDERTGQIMRILKALNIDLPDTLTLSGDGCDRCHNTGYEGQTAVAEIMEVDPKIQRLINEDDIYGIRDYLQEQNTNYTPIEINAMKKVAENKTDMNEIQSTFGNIKFNEVVKYLNETEEDK